MVAYCLYCNTLKSEEVAAVIRQRFGIRVISPKIVQRKWVKGTPIEEVHNYLPGYLFLYMDAPELDTSALFRMGDVYRVLGERDQGYRLMGSDEAFAQMLADCDGTLGVLKAFKEGDRVKLVEGALGGVAVEIVKLDRRGRALVRFDFDGSTMNTWVAYDMIDEKSVIVPQVSEGKTGAQ